MTRRKTTKVPVIPHEPDAIKIVKENCTDLDEMQVLFAQLAPGGQLIITFPRAWYLERQFDLQVVMPPATPLNVGTHPDITDREAVGFICSRSKS